MSNQLQLGLQSDATVPDAEPNALAVPEDEPKRGALADLRQHAMTLPSDVMRQALAEYADRRKAFRDFLLAQLVEGVHYGYPPGCEPKYDDKGNILIKSRGGLMAVSPKQWKANQCLYKAGADFVCDLMDVRPEFSADAEGWRQLGSPDGTFVTMCRLVSRSNGEILGEGRGVRRVGDKGGDANNACKMSEKSAKVNAVLNAYGLADLFTQDLDDEPQAPHDNPAAREDAPTAKPRAERGSGGVTLEQIGNALNLWKANRHDDDATEASWAEFVERNTGDKFNVRKLDQWTATRLHMVLHAIQIETVGDNG